MTIDPEQFNKSMQGTLSTLLGVRIVEATPDRVLAELTIRDFGSGVPEKELENLFRPFYRVADARERDTGGIGLGLAITYRAVKLHHGNVTAENAPGGGLLVRITLPAA